MQRSFSSLHRSENYKCDFNILRNTLAAVQLLLHLLMMAVLLFDILLLPLFYRLFNSDDFLIKILAGIVGSRAQVLHVLVFLLHVDQAHDWAVIALSEEDFDDLFLVLLGLLQALDLLGLSLDHFFKMLEKQSFQYLLVLVFLNRGQVRHLHRKVPRLQCVIKILEFLYRAIRDFRDKNNEKHKQESNSYIGNRCEEQKLFSGDIRLVLACKLEGVLEVRFDALHWQHDFRHPSERILLNIFQEGIHLSNIIEAIRSEHCLKVHFEIGLVFSDNSVEFTVDCGVFRSSWI
jgi:hypothetical protein